MANTLLAGAGCAGAHQQLVNLVGAVRAPVVHAFRGKEFVDWHPPRRYRWGFRLYTEMGRGRGSRFSRPPSGERPRAVTACPAAMFLAAFTSA
jgi:hypothetical protein